MDFGAGDNQLFVFNNVTGQIQKADGPLCLNGRGISVTMDPCNNDPTQSWTFDKGQLRNGHGLCLAGGANPLQDATPLMVARCNALDPTQLWGMVHCSDPDCLPSAPEPSAPMVLVSPMSDISNCTLNGSVTGCCVDLQYYNQSAGAVTAVDNCHPTLEGLSVFLARCVCVIVCVCGPTGFASSLSLCSLPC